MPIWTLLVMIAVGAALAVVIFAIEIRGIHRKSQEELAILEKRHAQERAWMAEIERYYFGDGTLPSYNAVVYYHSVLIGLEIKGVLVRTGRNPNGIC